MKQLNSLTSIAVLHPVLNAPEEVKVSISGDGEAGILLEIDVDQFLLGNDEAEYVERAVEPEEHLWQCVLIQALLDATMPEDSLMRRQARACLDTEVGVTAEYIDELCLRAGWEPGYFRRAYKHLKKNKIRLKRKENS